MSTSGSLIREARLRAGLSQAELGEVTGKDRAQIARWERDAVQPSFETLRQLVRACGYACTITLTPYAPDQKQTAQTRKRLLRSPQERVRSMLRSL